jgi:hypothetical protein
MEYTFVFQDNNDEPLKETQNSSNDQIKRPESVSLSNNTNELFVESNTTTPIDEMNSYFISTDPMTTSFVDGAPNSRNPFVDKSDDIEIIHHNLSSISTKNLMSSIEEINPQDLPIDDENHSKKTTKKATVSTTTSTNNLARKSKQTSSLSGSIFYVDVAYIPYHGNEHYVDSEFFRRIRARYYILNAVEINRLTLECLIEGKQLWDKQEQIPVRFLSLFLKKETLLN